MTDSSNTGEIHPNIAAVGSSLLTAAVGMYTVAFQQKNSPERLEAFEIIPTLSVPSEGAYAAVDAWTANLFYNEFVIAGSFTLALVFGLLVALAWYGDGTDSDGAGDRA